MGINSVKFKALEGDQLNRKAIKWRANENGDVPLIGAIDEIRQTCTESGQRLGHVRRYIIAYEWLPPAIVELILQELNIREVSGDVLDKVRETFGASIKKYHYFLWYKEHKFEFMP